MMTHTVYHGAECAAELIYPEVVTAEEKCPALLSYELWPGRL